MKIKTRYLVIAAAAILALSAAAALWLLTHAKGGSVAKIYVDGEVVRTVDLNSSGFFDVETPYGVNTIALEGGRIRVEDADCPDKLCVGMGWRDDDLVPIACLPHHLIIRVEGDASESVDAIAGAAP